MKFYYDSEKLKDIIKNYEIIDNNMIVNYLDGSTMEMGLVTEEKIKSIEEKMISQLKERNSDMINTKYIKTLHTIDLTFLSLFIISNIDLKINDGIVEQDAFKIVTMACVLCLFYDLIVETRKLNDIKKTNLFLDIYDTLNTPEAQLAISSLLGDSLYNKELTINTIDDYSYGTIKQIHKKVKKL